jgi:hypothetical protein
VLVGVVVGGGVLGGGGEVGPYGIGG